MSSSRSLRPFLYGAAALAAAGGVALYRRPFETARTAVQARLLISGVRERFVEVDGLTVRYLEAAPAGEEKGRPLILVHGLGGGAEDWARVIKALARRRRVLAPDLPGFWKTPAPPEGMSFSALARYLTGFMDALGVERAALAGNSLGGAVAIRLTAQRPERIERLFLLDSAGLLYDPPRALEPHTREEARELIRLVTGRVGWTPGFVLDGMIRHAAGPARRAYLRSEEPTDVKQDLPRLSVPTTIIWGEQDLLIPLDHGETLRDAIAGSELIVLAEVGHLPQTEAPREIVRIIEERLRG